MRACVDIAPVSAAFRSRLTVLLLMERHSNKGDSHDSQGVIRRCAACSCKWRERGYRLSDWLHEMRQRRRDLQLQRHPLGGVRQGRHVCIRNHRWPIHLRRIAVPVDQRRHSALLLIRRCRFRLFQLHQLERRHLHGHDDHGRHQRSSDGQRDRSLRCIRGFRAVALLRR